eukprot:6173293-Pleurochrysis_carterae.AAC.1
MSRSAAVLRHDRQTHCIGNMCRPFSLTTVSSAAFLRLTVCPSLAQRLLRMRESLNELCLVNQNTEALSLATFPDIRPHVHKRKLQHVAVI